MNPLPITRRSWAKLNATEQRECLRRPVQKIDRELETRVSSIVEQVREGGDAALRELTARFDDVEVEQLEVSTPELSSAAAQVSPAVRSALQRAVEQLESFHRAQLPQDIEIEVSTGIRCFRQSRPIERVGLYVPGGQAPLPSTVLMLGVPARLAGCPVRVLCTPPGPGGKIPSGILAAAHLVGVQRVFRVGGAQAVAALAFGTETIPKVDKVFGPGNAWVTRAKMYCAQDPEGAAYDLPAGPSEVMVVADAQADPDFVAADLLSQAEHGPDSQVVLVSDAPSLIDATAESLARQLETLPRREIAQRSLAHSVLLEVSSLKQAIEVANRYAPEHLILQVQNPERWMASIVRAGSVFLGPWAPEAVGDYASGTNHVLPTYGLARAYSGLSVDSFLNHITFQSLSGEGLKDIGPTVETLAELEGLEAHRRAVAIRLRGES